MKLTDTAPVATNGTIGQVSSAATAVLVSLGLSADNAGRAGYWIAAGLALVISAGQLLATRRKVTPIANPKTNDGTPLIPAGTAVIVAQAAPPAPLPAPTIPEDAIDPAELEADLAAPDAAVDISGEPG